MCSSKVLKQACQTRYETNTMGFCFTPRVICLAGNSCVNPVEENWIQEVAASSQADFTAPPLWWIAFTFKPAAANQPFSRIE